MHKEFEPYLDFWLSGQRQGFAGNLPRIKLRDGSKMVALCEHPLLYVDRWYGADLGGGQTLLYVLSESWKAGNPLAIAGSPVARLGYSGQILRRFSNEEAEALRGIFGDLQQSDIIWKVLRSALSQVSEKRPLRGPKRYTYPEFPRFVYTSEEYNDTTVTIGHESISYRDPVFFGQYDFTLIKRNLEDELPKIEVKRGKDRTELL